ncbi:Bacterial Ig-like domain (group 2) [compost metagenome]
MDVTNSAALSWTSSAPTIATISSAGASGNGLATGVAVGVTTLTASGTTNGTPFSATAELTVTAAVVSSLQVTPATDTVPVGLQRQFTATAFLSDGSAMDVTNSAALSWTSSAPAIATISSAGASGNGLATGVAVGATTITASGTANGTPFQATAQLTVTQATQPNFNLGCTMGFVTLETKTFACPLTQSEADAWGVIYDTTFVENGKTYIRMTWPHANDYCSNLGDGFYLPTRDELVTLQAAYTNLETYAGWPTNYFFRSSTETSPGRHYTVALHGIGMTDAEDSLNGYYVSCVRLAQ